MSILLAAKMITINRYARSLVQLILILTLTSFATAPAWARQARISTGKDLYEACSILSEFSLNPEGPTPVKGIYCRQFLAGYFMSVQSYNHNSTTKMSLDAPVYVPDCIAIEGPRSYSQMASRIVINGEWHPELMSEPAVKLVQSTFGATPPCPQK